MPANIRRGGLILCGGKSKRMGRPKHMLPFGDETLLKRVMRVVGEVVDSQAIVAADGQQVPALPDDVPVIHDEQPDLGPLSGLATGLAFMQDQADAVFVSSCDAPFLLGEFVNRLFELLGDSDMVILKGEKHYHPLAAIYRTTLAAKVRQLVDERRLRPIFLLEECNARVVAVEDMRDVDPDLLSLQNMNTPEQYAAALRAAGLNTSKEPNE